MQPAIIEKPTKDVLKSITSFRMQILSNNQLLGFLPFPSITGITDWEQIESLGFNPKLSTIEAIVSVKKSNGYSGNLCSLGSPEYVRFFIDWDDGNGFEDLGLSSFRAHDIPDNPPGPQHPISYMVSKPIDDIKRRKWCNTPVIVTLKAVLSWNQIPSADPNSIPYYGNTVQTKAVLKPLSKIPSIKLPTMDFQEFDFLPPKDLNLPDTPPIPEKQLDIKKFIKLNLDQGISPGRTMSQLMAISTEQVDKKLLTQLPGVNIKDFGFDFKELFSELDSKDFNVNYEEIVSVGLNPAQDTLGAVIHVKQKQGYGGDLCQYGSMEYVSFFADYSNDGAFESYLGTVSVKVNDIQNMPSEGLNYCVFLKNDFTKRLKYCNDPQVIRIRAILSWSTPPNQNPEQQVHWGNRVDTLVQLRQKKLGQTAAIYSIGNVDVDEISPITNLGYPGNSGRGNNRPWGGLVTIKGGIDNLGENFTKYRVEYSKNGVDYYPVTLTQRIRTYDFSNNSFTTYVFNDPQGWFPYLEKNEPNHKVAVLNQVLATWPSHSFAGKYYIRISYTHDPYMNIANVQHTEHVRIQLDNKRYFAGNSVDNNNTLDAYYDLDMTLDGGICKTFKQNDDLSGHVKVRDRFFGGYNLNIQPASQIIDSVGLIQYDSNANLNNSVDGDWGPLNDAFTIDLNKLKKCAYTLRLRGYERTILNDSHNFPYEDKYVGFAVN